MSMLVHMHDACTHDRYWLIYGQYSENGRRNSSNQVYGRFWLRTYALREVFEPWKITESGSLFMCFLRKFLSNVRAFELSCFPFKVGFQSFWLYFGSWQQIKIVHSCYTATSINETSALGLLQWVKTKKNYLREKKLTLFVFKQ